MKNIMGQGQVSDQSGVASKWDVLVHGHHCLQLYSGSPNGLSLMIQHKITQTPHQTRKTALKRDAYPRQ